MLNFLIFYTYEHLKFHAQLSFAEHEKVLLPLAKVSQQF